MFGHVWSLNLQSHVNNLIHRKLEVLAVEIV
jgi:hypothetical protein